MIVFNFPIFFSIIFITLRPTHCQRIEDISNLVRNVIENEGVPSTLWAKTCWSKMDDFKFTKSAPFFVQIVKSNAQIHLPIDEYTNKQWFFIDMKCNGATKFLSNINGTYFAHPYRWIIADATNESIQNLKFLPDSNIVLANKDSISDDYVLTQGKEMILNLSEKSLK